MAPPTASDEVSTHWCGNTSQGIRRGLADYTRGRKASIVQEYHTEVAGAIGVPPDEVRTETSLVRALSHKAENLRDEIDCIHGQIQTKLIRSRQAHNHRDGSKISHLDGRPDGATRVENSRHQGCNNPPGPGEQACTRGRGAYALQTLHHEGGQNGGSKGDRTRQPGQVQSEVPLDVPSYVDERNDSGDTDASDVLDRRRHNLASYQE